MCCVHQKYCAYTGSCVVVHVHVLYRVAIGIARIFVFSQYYLEIHCDGVDYLPSTVCNTWSLKFGII